MRWTTYWSLALLLSCSSALAEPTTTQPSAIQLAGIDGKTYEPLNVTGHRAGVLVFVLQDCPICNGYAPQIQRLAARHAPKGAEFYLIHVDPTLTPQAAREHASDYGYSIPVMIDRKHELVAHLGILTVPTAVVLGADGAVKYQGRIDDQFTSVGKARNVTTRYDLRDAVVATLAGEPVAESRTRAIGCAVPDLSSAK